MPTDCRAGQLEFEGVGGRRVVADFEGGAMTSDAGALLLRHADRTIKLIDRVAGCFVDHRSADFIVHGLPALVGQRIVGIALGYEDVSDHDDLRHDPLLALLAGRLEPKRRDCAVLAGKGTLNRLEHAPAGSPGRYHKISHDPAKLETLLVDLFLEAHAKPPKRIIIDLDATDDPLHGHQEGRFYHGYHGCHCYLPLYIPACSRIAAKVGPVMPDLRSCAPADRDVFCGRHLLAAKLRPSNIDASAGAKEEVERIVTHIRARWPRVRIWLRADAGFARDKLMTWCEANRIDYIPACSRIAAKVGPVMPDLRSFAPADRNVFGLARNDRLIKRIASELRDAKAAWRESGRAERRFKDFTYRTRKSWARRRRVIGKAEYLPKGSNPRFIVTSLRPSTIGGKALYEKIYCARGDMENRIKEMQLDLFADRTSTATMRANQLRLWFAAFAYVLIEALRRLGLRHTQFATATAGTIRNRLLKIGALVTISVRRCLVRMARAYPHQSEFALACLRLGRQAA